MTDNPPDPGTDEEHFQNLRQQFAYLGMTFGYGAREASGHEVDFATLLRIRDASHHVYVSTSMETTDFLLLLLTTIRNVTAETDSAPINELRGFLDNWVSKYILLNRPDDEPVQ